MEEGIDIQDFSEEDEIDMSVAFGKQQNIEIP